MFRHSIILSLLIGTFFVSAQAMTFHKGKFSTPEKEIPNECKGYMGGDLREINRYDSSFELDIPHLVLITDRSGNIIRVYDGAVHTTLGEVSLFKKYFYTDSILPSFAQSYKIEQFCAINEAINNGITDFKTNTLVIHVNTDKKFGEGPSVGGADHGELYDRRSSGILAFGKPLILDDRNDAVMAFVPILRNKDESIDAAVQRIFLEMVKQGKNEIKRVNKSYYEKQIPPLPIKPNAPSFTKINKESFETTEEFTKRVETTRLSEQKIREQTAQEYFKKLEYRNQRIADLEVDYANALEIQAKENQRIADWLFSNQIDIMKWIARNIVASYDIGGPAHVANKWGNKSVSYDADSGQLVTYLNYYSGSSKIVVFIPAEDAKRLSGWQYAAFPKRKIDLSEENGQLIIGKAYVGDNDGKWYEFHEGVAARESRKIEVIIQHEQINIPKGEASLALFKAGIPTVDILWQSTASVVVADLYNPKVPEWFSKPDMKNNTGYGTGLTLDDAKNDALRELALRNGMSVTAEQSTLTKANSFSITEETLSKKVDVKTSKAYTGGFKLICQEFVDGRWYVIVEKMDHTEKN